MQCEVCGKEAGKGKQIFLDGSTLIVCNECASFGTEKEEETLKREAGRPVPPATLSKVIMPPRFEREEFDLGLEMVPDFGKQIMKTRQKKGLTVKELGRKIFEKESLLHRVENQAIKPSDALIEKLEKELGIELKKKTG